MTIATSWVLLVLALLLCMHDGTVHVYAVERLVYQNSLFPSVNSFQHQKLSAKAFEKNGAKASKIGNEGESAGGAVDIDAKAQKMGSSSKGEKLPSKPKAGKIFKSKSKGEKLPKAGKVFKSKSAKMAKLGSDEYENEIEIEESVGPDDELEQPEGPDEIKEETPIRNSICGDGIVQNDEECDDGNTENGDKCSSQCTVESSCKIQLFNLQYPTPEREKANVLLYLHDLKEYNKDPMAFLKDRADTCGGSDGNNFASLGRLILGDYANILKMITSVQMRGAYVDPLQVNLDHLPTYFLMSLSDPGTHTAEGYLGIHQILHNYVWFDTVGKAQARIDSDESTIAALDSYVERLISEVVEISADTDAVDSTTVKLLSEQFTCRYMMKALFDLDMDDEAVANLQILWHTPGDAMEAMADPSRVTSDEYANIKAALETFSLAIETSPALADYEPSIHNRNMSKKEYANELVPLVGISALRAGGELIHSLFTVIPTDYEIRVISHREVAAAVLEAGRIKSPVNNVNVILEEPTAFDVNGESIIFPEGTPVALSLGLGSLDPTIFPNPNTFDHTRGNLMSLILNYNSIGLDPEHIGTRICPGRNIALKMGVDVLTAWLPERLFL